MKIPSRKSIAVPIWILVVGVLTWLVVSPSFRASVYREISLGGPYSRYDRLANLLRLGMTTDEVRRILGRPETQEDLEGGQRWMFCDDGTESTSGWTCIVDFSSEAGTLRLAYFFNVQHVVFTNSPHREIGRPIDGGEFRGDPTLKRRREQWYGGR